MNKISLTLVTVIVGVLLVFTFLQMEKPSFEMENKFIVVPQNSIVANDMDNIINNIVNIANDQQSNDSVKKKRAMVEVERLNETSMFQVNILAQSEKDVKELNEQVNYNILKNVAEYYDVETGIEIDVVKDGEIEKNALSNILPIIFWALVGILISILVVMIVELVSPKKENNEKVVNLRNVINSVESNQKDSSNAQMQNTKSTPVYDLQNPLKNTNYEFSSFQNRDSKEIDKVGEKVEQENIEKKEFEVEHKIEVNDLSNVKKPVEEKVVEVESKKDQSTQVKQVVSQPVQVDQTNLGNSRSGAPSNLPIVEFNAESNSDKKVDESQSDDSENGSDEPTEEELKARLNKLLKGEM